MLVHLNPRATQMQQLVVSITYIILYPEQQFAASCILWSWSLPSMSTASQDRAGQPARRTVVVVAVSPGDCLAVTL